MELRIDRLPPDGRKVSLSQDTEWVAAASADADSFRADLTIRGRRERVRVDVTGEVTVSGACERCGEPVAFSAPLDQVLSYVPEGHGAGEGEVELDEQDLDVGWYADGVLQLGDVVSELVALALPSRLACADESACDARVAAMLASHGSAGDPEVNASPFAVLKDLG